MFSACVSCSPRHFNDNPDHFAADWLWTQRRAHSIISISPFTRLQGKCITISTHNGPKNKTMFESFVLHLFQKIECCWWIMGSQSEEWSWSVVLQWILLAAGWTYCGWGGCHLLLFFGLCADRAHHQYLSPCCHFSFIVCVLSMFSTFLPFFFQLLHFASCFLGLLINLIFLTHLSCICLISPVLLPEFFPFTPALQVPH